LNIIRKRKQDVDLTYQ